jgi:hypothetical protein
MDKKEVKKDVPFFAQFLEEQEFPRVKSRIKAGKKPGGGNWPPVVTLKYPSDDDDDPPTVPL